MEPGAVKARIPYRPPYAWEAMLEFFARRAIEGVESIDDERYVRRLALPAQRTGWLSVRPLTGDALELEVSAGLAENLPEISRRVRRMFDTDADPGVIAERLGDLAREPGIRLPGGWEGFEIGVRAILGQQVSVAGARTVAGRFARAFGTPVESGVAFPSSGQVARVEWEEIARLGILGSKSRAILALAKAMEEGLQILPGGDPAETARQLIAIKGIGPWTASYIAMRALSDPDAFPAADLILMRALGAATPAEAEALVEPYRPWRAYAAIHLWRSI